MNGKDSLLRLRQHGVEQVPPRWVQSRVKYLGSYVNGYPFQPRDWAKEGRPILRIQDLTSSCSEPNRFNGEIPVRYLIQPGDILISWSASLGVYRWTGEESWLNQHIFKVDVDTRKIKSNFFFWLANWFVREMDREMHGSTMQHLTAEAFGGFPVLLPPKRTQEAISNYLDHETARLDALVAAKERLLDRLTEKRHTLIARAVTRGLDSDVPFRDSGISWIGDIPVHWELERARWLFKQRDERSVSGAEELLTVSHLTGVTLRSEKDVNMFEAKTKEGYKIALVGDLVINTLWAWMGAMGTSPVNGIVSPAYNVYKPGRRLDSGYIDSLVRVPNFAEEVTRHSKGVWSSRLRLYPESFFKLILPVPPIEEQKHIASYIRSETANLNSMQSMVERTMVVVKERRSALIAAAVTGQMKVESQHESDST